MTRNLIDAREAAGVPCITTAPVLVPEGWLSLTGVELQDWQHRIALAWGIQVAPNPA